jgi:DNA ligase-1
MKIKRPMKGEEVDESKLRFPLYVSPKLDGFRCLKLDGKALSSSFKVIRNVYTRNFIEEVFPDNLDGELMLADSKATFNQISSAFSSFEGEPDFMFHAFDYVMDAPFATRLSTLAKTVNHPRRQVVPHVLVYSLEELYTFEKKCLDEGYEGVMVRSIEGPYKAGRSTVK